MSDDVERPSIVPSLEEFLRRARGHRIVPVVTELIGDTMTPVGVFMSVVGDGDGFLLESVEGGERWGRYSFVGREPVSLLTTRDGITRVDGHDFGLQPGGILDSLEQLMATITTPPDASLPPLHSGVVGYLSYDVVREIERLAEPPHDDAGVPDAIMAVIGELIAIDHWRQRMSLIVNVVVPLGASDEELANLYADAVARLDTLGRDTCSLPSQQPFALPAAAARGAQAPSTSTMSVEEYTGAVKVAKEYITAGDIFQVVLSQRFDLEESVDAFSVYRALRLLNPSPYLYFLRFNGTEVAGSSPEAMVRVRDGLVTSRPIAGSRPRGATENEDQLLGAELIEDPKEVAEHIMLVDLARNDIGRIAEYGSEQVEELMTLERYSHIMHLTSQVTGRLRSDKGPIDVLRATLPAGTLSGAPKVRAMEIIDELETTRRGVYGGVVGYLDFTGNIDTAIAIRTLVVPPSGKASVQAGAGIVADSDPVREEAECRAKAAAVLRAVDVARSIRG